MVSFGNASGPAPAVAPLELSKRGSLYLTRPTLFDYTRARTELLKATQDLFAAIRGGVIRPRIGQTFALREAEAHRALESRRTTGSTVLIP